jgi:gliding motility-associated-like protein/uncharacterized repeat protein (TIGR01451 family)
MKLYIQPLIAFFLSAFIITTSTAQNGQFDVRFITKSFSCDSNKVVIAMQVKAHDMAHAFNMGDANYRFSYDPRVINTPTIVSQEHFSNLAPSSDFNYSTQTLTGSSAGLTRGIVSLNSFYTGVASSARRVDTAWTTICHLGFNIVSRTDCFTLTWHDAATFPSTNMNEVELLPNGEYNLTIVDASGTYTNLQACFQDNCSLGTAPSVTATSITTKQDSTATVCTSIIDPDANATFTTTVCGIAKHGVATPSVNGNQLCVQYAPTATFAGRDSVCITVCDNTNKCTDITIPITVNVRPSSPTIAAASITTKQDSTVTVCTTITDPDGGTFTATLCNTPLRGTATPSVNGSQLCVQYTPKPNDKGTDEICVRVCDQSGLCTNVSIPVTINTRPHAPSVAAVSLTTKQDSTAVVCTLITDLDAGSSFTATLCNTPLHGVATPSVNGGQLCVQYVPTANFSGTDEVCIRVCDNTGLCTNLTIPVSVNDRPHTPSVAATSIITKQDSTVVVCTTITDPDAGSLFTGTLCNAPSKGNATVLVNGTQLCVQYVPTVNSAGSDEVCVRICDNTGLCTTLTIPVTINTRPHTPSIAATSITTKQDSTVVVCTTITDLDAGSLFTSALCNDPLHGTATTLVNGTQLCIQYVPTANYAGTDEICVRVCDNTGLCTTITVPVTINTRPHTPSVAAASITTKQDSTVTVCTTITDLDAGATFTATLCNDPLHGIVTLQGSSVVGTQLCVQYVPTANYAGTDEICVRVCDNTGLCTTLTIPVIVNTRPHTPSVAAVSITTRQDSTASVCTTITDQDAGATFTATLCNTPLHGIVTLQGPSVDGNQLCIQYVPTANYAGTDEICVRVCDNTGLCTTVNIPVGIALRLTAPSIEVRGIVETREDSTATVCLPINDLTPNTPYEATICGQAGHGTATISVENTVVCLTYTPNAGYVGTDQVCIRVCETATGLCSEQTLVSVNVAAKPYVDGRILVGIRKRLSPTQATEVRLGGAVNYQITVKNNSTFTLNNVLVRDSVPTGMVLNQSNPQGWTSVGDFKMASKTIPSIAAGDSVTLDISLVLLYGTPRTLVTNRAFVFNASNQAGSAIITGGQEPLDTATFMIKPFDPMGVIYCENTGFILQGGRIELVSAPTGGSIFFASDANGTMLDGSNGHYQFFTNGVPGRYQVRYVHPKGYPLSTRCAPNATPLDPTNNDGDATDANRDGVIDKDGIANDYITLGSNVVNGDHLANFGCANNPYWLSFDLSAGDPFVFNNNIPIACGLISGTAGVDSNENGLFDTNESTLGNIAVALYREADLNTAIATATTSVNGKFIFDGLTPDNYRVKFTKPSGYRLTTQNASNNTTETNDSDADPITGLTQPIALAWGDADTTVGAYFVPTNINPPTITGTHIVTIEDSVRSICLPILDNTPVENFTASACGIQNGTITNLVVTGRQLCFRYTPNLGYRGADTLCLRVCDRDNQCDTARFTFDIQAKNNRFDCRGDGVAPVISFTNPILRGVNNGDTLTYDCATTPVFTVRDAKAVDNIDANPSLRFNDIGLKRGVCSRDGYKILLECNWSASDSCGNTSNIRIFIKIADNENPILSATPADVTVDLNAGQTIPTPPSVSATDNCGAATVAMRTDSLATGVACNYVLTRTWTATDECGNISTGVQRITVIKTCPCTPPTATVTKADETCGGANGTATIAVDNVTNYTFAWSDGSNTTNARTALSAGAYTVTVSRINLPSCQTVLNVNLINDTSSCCVTPQVGITATDATCFGTNGTASISVDIISNYTFTWSPNVGTIGTSPNVRTNLPAGDYSVTVTRVNKPNCFKIVKFEIGNNTTNCCTDFIPQTTMLTVVNGCGTIGDICIQMSNTSIASVTDNDAAYTSGTIACTGGLSVKLSSGTHKLVFKTTAGCSDSIEVKVACASPTPLTIENTMVLGTKDSIQLQTNELYGSRFTLRKIRGTTSGAVDYTNLTGTMVVTRTANQIGVEYATYVITDEYGITDTTYIKTEVISRSANRRPLALDDKIESVKGKSFIIDVMQNDSVRGTLRGVTIIAKAKRGTAVVTSDNRILYIPNSGFCGKDELTYTLCNTVGCDTAIVQISVLCDGVKVFNGFSPNGDNVNDNFVIEGIENYPNNTLVIYNRWGNNVLTVKGYKNDWQGEWQGTNVPDGTYFYIFDDGAGKIYKGFVQIQR